MNTVLSVACLAAVVAVSSAHLCMIAPHQRGSMMDINTAGSNDCILLKSPCGGRPSSTPTTVLKVGMNTTVTLQKNLDHWDKATPGYFALSVIQGTMIKELARVQDMGETSLHLYDITFQVPSSITIGQSILQATYVTKNAQAPPVFYQCADVRIEM